jgi:hypothetical protein
VYVGVLLLLYIELQRTIAVKVVSVVLVTVWIHRAPLSLLLVVSLAVKWLPTESDRHKDCSLC